jgi:uncharacterized protein
MEWSRYNRLFRSQRFGPFLYNALSNTLLELDEAHYRALEDVRERGGASAPDEGAGAPGGGAAPGVEAAADPDFVALLRENKVLVEAGEEQRILLARHYERQARCFDSSHLDLTVCPTLKCNFRCPYCFEHDQRDGATMSPQTIDRLIAFIQRHREARRLSLGWYGGEPTLAWGVIEVFTAKVEALDIDFEGAGLVTNGYLLSGERIARLNDLKIRSIQITLDGPSEMHDSRRVLAGGGPTYARILENVAALMASDYEGRCAIRVNLDKHNLEGFLELRAELLARFEGKKLSVYAGHVDAGLARSYDHDCGLDIDDWAALSFDLYRRGGHVPRGGFYPAANLHDVCVATSHNGFVVGPRGELYKCWEDVGKPEMVIGDVHEEEPITDPELRALYALGTDPYDDPECVACAALPICGGGCANKRLRAKHFHEEGVSYCSPYKEHLRAYLEEYYDTYLSRALLGVGLPPHDAAQADRGYRMVHPQKRCAAEEPHPLADSIGQER